MYQVIFNQVSASEMAGLPKELQLEILSDFQIIPEELDQSGDVKWGTVEREGRRLFRFRAGDYRIYFDRHPEGIMVHRVLHKNTIRDFLYRSSLPLDEDVQLGEARDFWKLIEEGEAKR